MHQSPELIANDNQGNLEISVFHQVFACSVSSSRRNGACYLCYASHCYCSRVLCVNKGAIFTRDRMHDAPIAYSCLYFIDSFRPIAYRTDSASPIRTLLMPRSIYRRSRRWCGRPLTRLPACCRLRTRRTARWLYALRAPRGASAAAPRTAAPCRPTPPPPAGVRPPATAPPRCPRSSPSRRAGRRRSRRRWPSTCGGGRPPTLTLRGRRSRRVRGGTRRAAERDRPPSPSSRPTATRCRPRTPPTPPVPPRPPAPRTAACTCRTAAAEPESRPSRRQTRSARRHATRRPSPWRPTGGHWWWVRERGRTRETCSETNLKKRNYFRYTWWYDYIWLYMMIWLPYST